MQISEEQMKLANIFHPYALGRQSTALANKTRFVHYTNADAAIKILDKKEVWMRKSSAMNDFREVHHGLDCLIRTFSKSEAGKKFRSVLNSTFDGLDIEIAEIFDSWIPHFQNNTYLTCVSEHNDTEDFYGRLSMWRAYGAGGIAFVMNSKPFLSPSNALKAYTSPVAYLDDNGFQTQFDNVTSNINENLEFLQEQGRDVVKNLVFHMFKMAVLCTKHPGFEEEKEWRVVYSPSFQQSDRLIKDIQVINGVPQPIYKIPLNDVPEEGFVGAEIPDLIERVIIGPTQFPLVTHEAIVEMLIKAGVKAEDAHKRVFISDIPLRR